MSRFTTTTNYPLIPNSNEYMIEQRIVSIHSEDRDITKWPSSSNFEIELPDDYVNVSTVKLGTYTFPSNYNTFSLSQSNIKMSFIINKPYYPSDNNTYLPDEYNLLYAIYLALYKHINNNFIVVISEGFYNSNQIAEELTNRFNEVVDHYVYDYLSKNNPDLLPLYKMQGGYKQFVVVYNQVKQTLWFGNKSSMFTLTNDDVACFSYTKECLSQQLDEFYNWGLPAFLGFTRCPISAIENVNPGQYPRFYYGDALTPGDKGYWLIPDPEYKTQKVYYLEAPAKVNLLGNSYFYLEIAGLNNIDETSPFSLTHFTATSNETNGVHNSAFAKIGVVTTPLSQWYDSNSEAVKIFNPPAERIRKIKIRIRYHNGALVDFGKTNFSFNLIFQVLRPQNLRYYITFDPTSYGVSPNSSAISKRSEH